MKVNKFTIENTPPSTLETGFQKHGRMRQNIKPEIVLDKIQTPSRELIFKKQRGGSNHSKMQSPMFLFRQNLWNYGLGGKTTPSDSVILIDSTHANIPTRLLFMKSKYTPSLFSSFTNSMKVNCRQ